MSFAAAFADCLRNRFIDYLRDSSSTTFATASSTTFATSSSTLLATLASSRFSNHRCNCSPRTMINRPASVIVRVIPADPMAVCPEP